MAAHKCKFPKNAEKGARFECSCGLRYELKRRWPVRVWGYQEQRNFAAEPLNRTGRRGDPHKANFERGGK